MAEALLNISDKEFSQLQRFIYDAAGISLAASKKPLVCGRLMKRLRHYNFANYSDYLRLITTAGQAAELQTAIDLLTTNETYFFRESKHFDFLSATILPAHPAGRGIRIWSAACSSGEEPYSIAMLLEDKMPGKSWQIVASDISSRVLEQARQGKYRLERAQNVPKEYLSKFCLRGVGAQAGHLMVDQRLRSRIDFRAINLNETLPEIGVFDVIFLRNVMIYFDTETKRKIIERLAAVLAPGGYFFVGHSESLHGINHPLKSVQPAIYQRA